jgi:hypothetical protein
LTGKKGYVFVWDTKWGYKMGRDTKWDVYDFMLFFESFNLLPIKA